jgi:beta-lactamase class A
MRALEAQLYNTEIPAGLPRATRVAHKTGWISESLHDGALVWPEYGPPFSLAVFTTGFIDQPTAGLLIRRVAAMCWQFWTAGARSAPGASAPGASASAC